jgi:hypothetical protein
MQWNFLESLVGLGVLGGNLDKPSGTLLNCLESLVGTGRDFAKMVLFQCSGGFGSLSKKQ